MTAGKGLHLPAVSGTLTTLFYCRAEVYVWHRRRGRTKCARGGKLYVFADRDARMESEDGITIIQMPEESDGRISTQPALSASRVAPLQTPAARIDH